MAHIYINPVNNCNLCNAEFDGSGPMYDARLLPYSTWANLCEDCFTTHNCKLGTGYGQKYELQELDDDKGAWVKIEG
jgi:hypothetical protein